MDLAKKTANPVTQEQLLNAGESFVSAGIKSSPFLRCMPVDRAFPSILRLLLGLANGACRKFKENEQSRIEK